MLRFANKKVRAEVIAAYIKEAGYRGCVCFSCGNASRALKDVGLYVVEVAPQGDLQSANKWWTPEEIHRAWPDLFDATSGHLPAFLMVRIGRAYRELLGVLEGQHNVPTGSGETIQCLRWAYPNVKFQPVFDCGQGTERHEQAPLLDAIIPK